MTRKEMRDRNLIPLSDIIDKEIGKIGTPRRDAFERDVKNAVIGIQIQEHRRKLKMTQEELARKVNKKREYISRVENNCGNITLKSLRDIVETGLGGKLKIEIVL